MRGGYNMIKVTNISERDVYIGTILVEPLTSYTFEKDLTDKQKRKIETLFKLGLIQVFKVDKVTNLLPSKKKNKK